MGIKLRFYTALKKRILRLRIGYTDVVRKKDHDERIAGIDFPRVYI